MTIRDDNDAEFDLVKEGIHDAQDAYLSANGEYEKYPKTDLNGKGFYEIQVYKGPQGSGYICFRTCTEGATDYECRTDHGPEGRGHAWIDVKDDIL